MGAMKALTEAIELAGGVGRLASLMGLRQNVVSNWKMREQVPPDQCPAIELATGVRCEALRNDVAWQRDDSGRVTGYVVPVPAPDKAA